MEGGRVGTQHQRELSKDKDELCLIEKEKWEMLGWHLAWNDVGGSRERRRKEESLFLSYRGIQEQNGSDATHHSVFTSILSTPDCPSSAFHLLFLADPLAVYYRRCPR